ncbi:MAG: hypothetical protein WBM62_02590 [Crocosphaera sp.]
MIEPGVILRMMEGMAIRSLEGAAKQPLVSYAGEQTKFNYPVLQGVNITKEEKDKIAVILSNENVDFRTIKKLFNQPKTLNEDEKNQIAKLLFPELGYDKVSALLG